MNGKALQIEGQWEEVLEFSDQLRGRKVRVVTLDEPEVAMGRLAHASPEVKRAVLARIDGRCARMNPRPDPVDFLREGRAGAMWGHEPEE